jgi:hypothetical protein
MSMKICGDPANDPSLNRMLSVLLGLKSKGYGPAAILCAKALRARELAQKSIAG